MTNQNVNLLQALHTSYAQWNDPLSQDLHAWIATVCQKLIRDHTSSLDKEINQLFDQILVDPLTSQPLQQPVMFADRLWERAVWQKYATDQQTSLAKTHDFAIALMDCINQIKPHEKAQELVSVDNAITTSSEHIRFNRILANDLEAYNLKIMTEDLLRQVAEKQIEIENSQRTLQPIHADRIAYRELHTRNLAKASQALQESNQRIAKVKVDCLKEQTKEIENARLRLQELDLKDAKQQQDIRYWKNVLGIKDALQ